jgi:hypothetical protein
VEATAITKPRKSSANHKQRVGQEAAELAKAGEANKDDLDLYSRVAANLRRLLESVGLQRRVLDLKPQNIRERLLVKKDVVDVG